MSAVKVALGQINPTIGDFEGNRRLVLEATAAAERAGRRAGDLSRAGAGRLSAAGSARASRLPRRGARRRWRRWPTALAPSRTAVVVGFPGAPAARPVRARRRQQRRADRRRARHARRAQVAAAHLRRLRRMALLRARGRGRAGRRSAAGRSGLSICEDIWNDADFWPHRLYRGDPIEALVRGGRGDHPQRLGVAVHDREAPPAPAHARGDGARAGSGRCCSSTRSAARTTWCSTAPAWRSTPAAR